MAATVHVSAVASLLIRLLPGVKLLPSGAQLSMLPLWDLLPPALALWKTAVSPTGDEQRRLLGVAEQPAELLEHRSAPSWAGPLMELHRGPWWSYSGAPGGATPGPLVELHRGPWWSYTEAPCRPQAFWKALVGLGVVPYG
ncbi:unnamed protein product [Boreogadus saida]